MLSHVSYVTVVGGVRVEAWGVAEVSGSDDLWTNTRKFIPVAIPLIIDL